MTKDDMDAAAPTEPDPTVDDGEDWATATDLFHLDAWIARHPARADPDRAPRQAGQVPQ